MTSRHKKYDDDDEKTPSPPTQPEGEIAPGCSEPGAVPPSVAGTSQDKKPKPQKEE